MAKAVVPGGIGGEVELVDKQEMEQALLDAYEIILAQANDTPCLVSPLKEQMGKCGTGEIINDVLLGKKVDFEGIDEATR